MKYYFNKRQTINIGGLADSMWDRSGVVTPGTDIIPITAVGLPGFVNFSKACELRAAELAGLGKRIYILWSGGLDSTAVFLLMREVVHHQDLVVLHTKESYDEYPGFFENNIKGVYETHLLPMVAIGAAIEKYCQDGIIVTGEIGDQVFGSMLFMLLHKDQLLQGWRSFNNKSFYLIPRIEEFVSQSYQKIETVADMLWWINYTMKYQYVQLRMLLNHEPAILNKNVYHFFDTKEFNDYAVSTELREKIPCLDVRQYKFPMRELIYRLSKDSDYSFNKLKVPSLGGTYSGKDAIAIDTNWVRHYESD